jgi:hypothetical protein
MTDGQDLHRPLRANVTREDEIDRAAVEPRVNCRAGTRPR